MSFTEIVEEMHELSFEEKLELKHILERDLLEERDEELLHDLQDAKNLEKEGSLSFYDTPEAFISALRKA